MGRVQKYVCSTRPSARCYWLLAEVANTVDLKCALGTVVMDIQESLLAAGSTIGLFVTTILGINVTKYRFSVCFVIYDFLVVFICISANLPHTAVNANGHSN